MHQYVYLGKGKTIHSSVQVEHFGNNVNDKSVKVKGGKQCITTLDGFAIPLQIRGGLAYLDMHPPDDKELETLPHVVLTSDAEWNPTIVDCEIDKKWLDAQMDLQGFSEYGDQKSVAQGNYGYSPDRISQDIDTQYTVENSTTNTSNDNQKVVRLDPTEGETPTSKIHESSKLHDPTKVGNCEFDRTSTSAVKSNSSFSMVAAKRCPGEKIDQNFLESEKERRFGATTSQKFLEPEHAKEIVATPYQSSTGSLQRHFLLDDSDAKSSARTACDFRSEHGYLDFFKGAPSQRRNSFILEYVKLQQKRVQWLERGAPSTDGRRKIRDPVKWRRVRQAVMAGTLLFFLVIGKDNPADNLTKRSGLPQLRSLVLLLLLSLGCPLSGKGEVETVSMVI
jgi:hypothetical protein